MCDSSVLLTNVTATLQPDEKQHLMLFYKPNNTHLIIQVLLIRTNYV